MNPVHTSHTPNFRNIHSDIILPSTCGLFPSGALLISPMRTTCPAHLIHLDLKALNHIDSLSKQFWICQGLLDCDADRIPTFRSIMLSPSLGWSERSLYWHWLHCGRLPRSIRVVKLRQSQSCFYRQTVSQSVSQSMLASSPFWDSRSYICFIRLFCFCPSWGVLTDGGTGLSFIGSQSLSVWDVYSLLFLFMYFSFYTLPFYFLYFN